MKPLPVTAVFGEPCAAKSELTARLLSLGKNHASLRFAGDAHGISGAHEMAASAARENTWEHAILDVEGTLNPLALAPAFAGGEPAPAAYLAATVSVVETEKFLGAMRPGGAAGDFAQGYPNDLAQQLEVSDFIVMPETADPADWQLAKAMALALNPRAVIATPAAGAGTLRGMLDARHDPRLAQGEAGWQRSLRGCDGFGDPEQKVGVFLFEARRPFHPRRLWELMRGPLPGVFRARGFLWLATRMPQVLGLARAGREVRFAMVGQWWAGLDRGQWPADPEFRAEVERNWAEPYGDRQQAIVLMCGGADFEEIRGAFNACLLTEDEMAGGESGWSALEDPLPAWSAHTHDHGHAHSHEHDEHHDCCGHH